MAPNKRKILEAARKYAQKGAKDRALKEYERLLKLDPRDAKLRLEIGDAHRRWGQVEEAVAAYLKVADQYMNEGFDARAVAVFKQIQNLDPGRYACYVPLAELYQRMGLTSEAIQALQTAADGYHREGNKREALDLLRRMATLDPSNTTSRIKVADLLQQEKLHKEAIAEYEEAHAELERQGESEAASNVLERILEIEPHRVPALVQLAQHLLKRGFAERAEPFVKRALERDPEETAHYELLADVYRAQQRDAQLSETYRSLADLYRRRGDEDRAREIIQRFVPPDGLSAGLDRDALLAEEPILDGEGPTLLEEELLEEEIVGDAVAPQPSAPARESFVEETVLEVADGPEIAAPTQEISAPRQLDPEFEQAGPEVQGDPEQLLAEASVYLRYGKRAPALKNLHAILEKNPQHREALEKLGEAHADAGDSAAAVEAWSRAAERARGEGDAEGFGVLRDRIAALDEQAAAALGSAAAEPGQEVEELLEVSEVGPDAPRIEEPLVEAPGLEFEDDIEVEVGGEEVDADAATRTAAPRAAEPAGEDAMAASGPSQSSGASMSQQIQEELEEAEFYRQQGLLDEAEVIYQRILDAAPNHPLALVRMGEIAAERGDDPGSSGTGLTLPPDSAQAEPLPEASGSEQALGQDLADWDDDGLSDTDVDLERSSAGLLEEPSLDAGTSQDLEVSEGLSEEAPPERPAPPAEVEIDIDDEIEGGAVAEDEAGAVAEDEAAAEDEAGETTGVDIPLVRDGVEEGAGDAVSFDLAAELSEAFDENEAGSSGNLGPASEDDGFAAVFQAFKRGVRDTLNEGDHEAHYDLGIAYREMGLLEDAIGEFQSSRASPARRVDSLHMLGLCTLDLGRAQEAVTHLREALDTARITEEQGLVIRFELGRAFESQGQIEEARAAWEAVAAVDPAFCEVEERLAALGRAKPDDAVASDEGFESFGDLFEEEGGRGEPETAAAGAEAEPLAAQAHESFEDLLAEANEAPEEDAGLPAPKPAPEPRPEPRRRRKKISFV